MTGQRKGYNPPAALRKLIDAGLVGLQAGYEMETDNPIAVYVLLPAVPEKEKTLSDETRSLISYWLRGWNKGYGVNLYDYYDGCLKDDEKWLQVLQELYDLSDKSVVVDELEKRAVKNA